MGNSKSRSSSIAPVIEKQQIKTNIIEPNKTKCNDCGYTGYAFNVVSRDGTTFIKMYYCGNCSNSWKS